MKKDTKYILFIPKGGWSDAISNFFKVILKSRQMNRTLLVDWNTSVYRINFATYFDIHDGDVLYDTDEIKRIIRKRYLRVHPKSLQGKLESVLNNKIIFEYGNPYNHDGHPLSLPQNSEADIIVHSKCGGKRTSNVEQFSKLTLKDGLKAYCKQHHAYLLKRYLCIHVRNTDYTSNYKKLYQDNMQLINSYDQIYVCTDDIDVVTYFKGKHKNVKNFCVFHDNKKYKNLHGSSIDGDTKIKNLLCDIYIATQSTELISNSKGGFTQFLRNCVKKKQSISKMFD